MAVTCTYLNNSRTRSAVQSPLSSPAWGQVDSDRLGYDGAGRMITKRWLGSQLNEQKGYDDTWPYCGFTAAYDHASNKLYERHLHAESRSHLYPDQDSLGRLRQYQRGTLQQDSQTGAVWVATPISLPGTDQQRTYDLDGPWKAQAPKTLWKDEVTKPFAAFFGHDWGDNGKLHVLAVTESGLMRYSVDGSAPPANYGRLTGHAKYMRKEDQAGLKPLAAFPLDIDGNGQMDLVVLTQSGGGFELCNRGFGCFLVNPDVPGAFFSRGRSRVPFTLKNTTRIVGADLHGDRFDDAAVLAEDGKLCEISNTPYPPHP
jgi:hypothetical protein